MFTHVVPRSYLYEINDLIKKLEFETNQYRKHFSNFIIQRQFETSGEKMRSNLLLKFTSNKEKNLWKFLFNSLSWYSERFSLQKWQKQLALFKLISLFSLYPNNPVCVIGDLEYHDAEPFNPNLWNNRQLRDLLLSVISAVDYEHPFPNP